MRRTLLPTLLLVCACAPMQSRPLSPEPASIAVAHVHVVPMDENVVLRDQTVLIRGNRIAEIGAAERVRIPRGARLIDGRGKYLIPGLWDTHVHAVSDPDRQHVFSLLLANGVTGVRDMGAELDALLAVREWIAENSLLAPRLVAAGPLLDGPKHRWSHSTAWHLEIREQARVAVDSLERAGVDFLKIYGSLPREAYFAVAEEARRLGLPFAGHIPLTVGAAEASDAGQASFEHAGMDLFAGCVPNGTARVPQVLGAWGRDGYGAYFEGALAFRETRDEACTSELLALLRRNRTWIVPTIVNEIKDQRAVARPALEYLNPERRQSCRRTVEMILAADETLRSAYYRRFLADIKLLHEAGVPIMAGTDLGNPCVVAGFSTHDELEHLVEAGLSTFDALRTATVNPARFLARSDLLGTVRPGMLADLVLLDGNPLETIGNTRQIAAVITDGHLLDRAELDRRLAEAKAAARP